MTTESITHTTSRSLNPLPELLDAEALGNDLKRILVRSESALLQGDAKANVEQLERWIESYRRGLSAAQKISDNGSEMLNKTRDQLKLALDEWMRLEDDGGNPPNKENAGLSEELTSAIRRIDRLLPVVESSFNHSSIQSCDTP
jgi:gas vesicle protein